MHSVCLGEAQRTEDSVCKQIRINGRRGTEKMAHLCDSDANKVDKQSSDP